MQTIDGLDNLSAKLAGCVVTIGNFDGVHSGHQGMIAVARRLADQHGGPVVAMTFDPPPVRLLAPAKAPRPLMRRSQKLAALGDAGVDIAVVLHTTAELLSMTPEAFVRDILVERLAPRHVVEGRSFFFGKDRAGNIDTLRDLSGRYGFEAHEAGVVTADLSDQPGVVVSSSLIRRLVAAGEVEDAAACLTRPYTMLGEVVPGHGRGRKMHYPTANLDAGEQLHPGEGVYAGLAEIDGDLVPAAISVGPRPTFDDPTLAVEAYLLDATGQLYGQTLALQFVSHLRGLERFDSPESLRAQMDKDVQRVKELLV